MQLARPSAAACAALFVLSQNAIGADHPSDILRAQTQALMNAVSNGNRKPWRDFLDDDVSYTDENGVLAGKKAMVDQVVPLPKGISGHIDVIDWKATIVGSLAITTHIDDEHENFHGQRLHAQYRDTQTWVQRKDGWKLISEQAIALQQDPPIIKLPAEKLAGYVGIYRAGPDLTYAIARDGDGLSGTVEGAKAKPIRFELLDVAFADGQPRVRKLFQRDASGHVTGFLSRREGRDVVWKKIK